MRVRSARGGARAPTSGLRVVMREGRRKGSKGIGNGGKAEEKEDVGTAAPHRSS